MANKKYNEFNLGSFDAAKILLIADPDTGALEKIPLSDIPTLYTGDGGISANRTVSLNGHAFSIDGGTAISGNAGNISIVAPGSNGTNDAGNVVITGGLKADGAGVGGDVIITSGGATVNDVGDIFLIGASALDQGRGGHINLTGGNGEGENEGAGSVTLSGGVGGSPTGEGGNVALNGGSPGVGGNPGRIDINSGAANVTGDGATVSIIGGTGGATSGNGALIQIIAGSAQGGDGNGGSVVINTGEKNGSGSYGKFTVNYMDGGDPEVMLDIDPTGQTHTFKAGGETNLSVQIGNSFLRAFNDTANGNTAIVDVAAGISASEIDINANFNDGIKQARIQAVADATTATLTFTGDMIVSDLAGGGTTGLSIDNDGKLIRTP